MEELLNLMNGYTINDAKIKSITKEYFPMRDKHNIIVVLQHGSCGQNETRLYLDALMHEDLDYYFDQSKPVKKKLTGIDSKFKEAELDADYNAMSDHYEDNPEW